MKHRRNSELEELEEQLRRAEAEEAAADVAQTDEYPDEDGYEDDFDGWLDDEMDEYGVPDDEDPSPLYQNYVNGYGRVPEEAVYADEVEEPDDRRESMNRRAVMKASGGRRRKKKRGCGCLTALLVLALVIVGGLCLFVRPPRAEGEQRQRKRDTATILICGTDADGTRTDTMMLLYLSGSERKVNLLSLPRDTYTLTSSGKAAKLNSAYGRNGTGAEGMEVLLDYVRDIIGYRPDGYILLDFTMVPRIVDIMGGVDVEVPMDMDVDEIVLSKGYQHLSRDQAVPKGLRHCRSGTDSGAARGNEGCHGAMAVTCPSCGRGKGRFSAGKQFPFLVEHRQLPMGGQNAAAGNVRFPERYPSGLRRLPEQGFLLYSGT